MAAAATTTTTTTTEEQSKHSSDKTLAQHEQSEPQLSQSLEASTDNPSPDADVSAGGDDELKSNSGTNGGEELKPSSGDPADDNSGVANHTLKKKLRAERFGMPVQLSEQEKRNSRAERFGTGPGLQESDTSKKSDDLKRKARAERFGLEQSVPAAEDEKKKARLARFAPTTKTDPVEEDKKKARALRFSETSPSLLHPNGEGIEAKTAISNKASGGA